MLLDGLDALVLPSLGPGPLPQRHMTTESLT